MKTKKKLIYSHKCDYCNRELILNGKDSDSYVVTAELKYFCIIQTPGKPAERDCMKDYLERLEARPRVLAKLAELDKFFKEKQIKNRYR